MYRGMKVGQYIPVDSILHNLDARTKIISILFLLILVVIATFPYKLGLIFLLTLALTKASKVRLSIYIEALRPFALIIFITVILQLFLVKGTPLFSWAWFSISKEGVFLALSISIRLILLLLIIRVLTATTTPAALMAGIEKLLKPFSYMGLPVEELVMIMTISLRFIPLFIEEARRLHLAQIARGVNFNTGNIKQRFQSLASLFIPLFRISFNRAADIAIAMEARCYNGGEGRTHLHTLRLGKIDYFFITGLLFIVIFILV